MGKIRVGVIFGGRSVEHEVSIITVHHVLNSIDKNKYEVIPIYIAKNGEWRTGEKLFELSAYKELRRLVTQTVPAFISPVPAAKQLLFLPSYRRLFGGKSAQRLDVVLPLVHGTHGEDGTLQGLLELADIPYVGARVLGSAIGMDKIVMKMVFRDAGLPVVNYHWFRRRRWERDPTTVISEIESRLTYPLFVKPANLGSSIGISKAKEQQELKAALEIASNYDRRLLVEESVEGAIEINCAVLGCEDELITSVCEQPLSWEEFLSYDQKYLQQSTAKGMKSTRRRIPAPISDDLTRKIQDLAKEAFMAIDCQGVARVDFLVMEQKNTVYVNEINTIPGSLACYLWAALGIPFAQLIEHLIETAFKLHQEKKRSHYSYASNLLAQFDQIPMDKRVK